MLPHASVTGNIHIGTMAGKLEGGLPAHALIGVDMNNAIAPLVNQVDRITTGKGNVASVQQQPCRRLRVLHWGIHIFFGLNYCVHMVVISQINTLLFQVVTELSHTKTRLSPLIFRYIRDASVDGVRGLSTSMSLVQSIILSLADKS